MPLCSLCRDIPWETLPSVPPDECSTKGQHIFVHRYYQWPESCGGYPHHQSLEALRISATLSYCDLCRLILKQVESCQEAATLTLRHMPVWEFWIVKRGNGADGIWVMGLMDGAEQGEVVLVAAIGLCVKEGDPLESIIRGRPVEQHGGTLTAISRVRKWVKECDEHPSCCPGETLLPSRVIDVGVSTTSPHVKLYETGAHDRGIYMCLSYCWGNTPGYTSTKATLADQKRLIMISELPKTHQDVIELARHLRIRYVWIDSICICQDDQKDWEQESAKMLSIYGNAYLTVSASRAQDSSQGLFGERPAREYVELEHTSNNLRGQALAFALPFVGEIDYTYPIDMQNEPLSDRAWSLQERAGSSRTVLYGTPQLFFECNEGFQAEDGWFVKSRFESIRIFEKKPGEIGQYKLENGNDSGTASRNKTSILRSWQKLVGLYGERKLTYASDKLPAISGVASIFAKLLDDEYVAGLWRSQLTEGLLWQGPTRRVQEYRSPSWSWGSVDGRTHSLLHQDYYKDCRILAKVLNVNVDLKGANPYGEVTKATLKMRAPMERLYIATEDLDPHNKVFSTRLNPKVRTANGKFEGTYAAFDFDYEAEDGPQEVLRIVKSLEGMDVFALIFFTGTQKFGGGIHYVGLIIAKANSDENYQRLGIIYFEEEALGQKPEERPEEQYPIVILV